MLIIKSEIMDEAAVRRSLTRITHEIMERNRGTADLCILGIRRRGAALADILADNIEKFEGTKVPVAYIDITLYRDDLSEYPSGIRIEDNVQITCEKAINLSSNIIKEVDEIEAFLEKYN